MITTVDQPPPRSLPPLAWCIALLLFIGSLFLYTYENGYPYIYEPDGPSKVGQVISGERNFRHPALMLNTASAISHLTHQHDDPQAVAEAGRLTSALFAALGVAAMALVGWYLEGALGAVVGATLVAVHPQLVELTHYFKEDATLIGALSLVMLGIVLVCDRASKGRIAFLGLAAGLVIAAKYIGITGAFAAAAALGVGLRRLAYGRKRLAAVVLFLAVLIATVTIANYQTVLHPSLAQEGVANEMGEVVAQPKFTEQVPYFASAWNRLKDNSSKWSRVAFVVAVLLSLARRPLIPGRLFVLGFPIAYWVMLLFSPHQFSRYYLPVAFFLTFGAGLGVIAIARLAAGLLSGWIKVAAVPITTIIPLAAGAVALYTMMDDGLKVADGFRTDTHRELAEWMRKNVPPDAVVAQDERTFLNGKSDAGFWNHVPQQVITKTRLSKFQTEEELRALGVNYLAVHDVTARKWLSPKKYKTSEESKSFLHHFTREHGTIVWQSKGGTIGYLAPKLRLIQLSPFRPEADLRASPATGAPADRTDQ